MYIDMPDKAQLPALRALWQEAFGDPQEFLELFFETAFSPQRCRCVAVEGEPAAALYWFDCSVAGQKIAYIYAVATAKKFRGRGLCRKLMEHVHMLLSEQGYAGSILVPGEKTLFDFYRPMGYTHETQVLAFTCSAAAEPAELMSVDSREYARKRKALLPACAVVQEGENLAFLEKQAQLYAGRDFLLAAVRQGSKLLGLELLGNTEAAAGIVRALGCSTGTFRTPGEGKVHALYRPIRESVLPDYIAFDFG